MKVFRLAAVIVLLASPVYAQNGAPSLNLLMDNKPAKSQDEKDAEAAREKAYQDSLKKIPDAKAPADPWGNVRANDAPKSAASTKKTKTGSTAN
jgi:hypothetical protein